MTSRLVIGVVKVVCLAVAGCIALAGCHGCSTTPADPTSGTQSGGGSRVSSTQPAVVQVGGGKEGRYDLGRVPAGSKHTVAFIVDNPTDQPLVFKTVRGDCECITAENPPKEIAAHSSVTITVSYVAPTPAIEYDSAVIILTTNPQRKEILLHVKSSPP